MHLKNHILKFLIGKLVDIGVHLEPVGHEIGEGFPLRILWYVESLFDLEKINLKVELCLETQILGIFLMREFYVVVGR